MAKINMRYMPAPKSEGTVNLSMLNGGLNINDLDFRLKNNESPAMKNLIWREGVLCSRDGQVWWTEEDNELGTGRAFYERLFNGFLVAHIGVYLYCYKISDYVTPDEEHPLSGWTQLMIVGSKKGVFFSWGEKLYYKSEDRYVCITYDSGNGTLSGDPVTAYTPIILINADPATGAGDLYQPVNRISYKREVWYSPTASTTVFQLPEKDLRNATPTVLVNGTAAAVASYDKTNGTVTLSSAVSAGDNTVSITYEKADSASYNSVMKCKYAATYGGTGELCLVLGGCPAQPNAIFWSGNTAYGQDPGYFPMENYQLVGSFDDPVTGFGKQQSYLVIFQERSVGRVKQDTTELEGRTTIDMPYVAINSKIGCDLPWTIQLVENNLVWCNKEHGVHILKDCSAAYESNIECLSLKINGGPLRLGLLNCVRSGEPCSLDDGHKYWLANGGECWVWDYENTSYKDPSWYYYTDVPAVAFASELEDIWHINSKGRLSKFERVYYDYDENTAIDKSYRFATQYFGDYDKLKNVNSVIIAVRHDTNSNSELTYYSDYAVRKDPTNLRGYRPWRLVPRDLSYRNLDCNTLGTNVFRRRPMCRRVKHFTMQLDNNEPRQDLSIVSAQIFYNMQGRLR